MKARASRLERMAGILVVWIAVVVGRPSFGEVVSRCGKGYLERLDGRLVLHLKGTPYEMGFQHGVLLKDHVRALIHYLFEVKAAGQQIDWMGVKLSPRQVVQAINQFQRPFVPPRFQEEMSGLAEGSAVPLEDVQAANAIPELFHCSGFALLRQFTVGDTLLHGRVLDYSIDWRLQDHAVLVIAEPYGRIPFANVTYAGFVGSVTGMNREQISIGEMGGKGLYKWSGVPMAFLVRRVLEEARSLDEGIAIFRESKRTCEYFYVLADGRSNRAVGIEGSADRFMVLQPGEAHARLPTPVSGAVLMSAGSRYDCLCEFVQKKKSAQEKFTVEEALRLMDAPVAMKSNLHNVLMAPALGKLWIAHASTDCKPAWTQKYVATDFWSLLVQPLPTVGGIEYPPPRILLEAAIGKK